MRLLPGSLTRTDRAVAGQAWKKGPFVSGATASAHVVQTDASTLQRTSYTPSRPLQQPLRRFHTPT